jgi:isocitrate dehydrogenase
LDSLTLVLERVLGPQASSPANYFLEHPEFFECLKVPVSRRGRLRSQDKLPHWQHAAQTIILARAKHTKHSDQKTITNMHPITLIPGDGIGPEVTSNVVRIIEATGVDIQWETHYAGAQALEKFGETLPKELLDSILRNKVALKGPITTPVGKGFTSVNVGLRKTLDLYANLRPVRALPNVQCRYPELDLVVVRENTESLYAGTRTHRRSRRG